MSMVARCYTALGLLVVVVSLATLAEPVLALPPAVGVQAGAPVKAGTPEEQKEKHHSGSCNVEVPVIGGLVGGACEAAGEAAGAVGGVVGEAAEAAGNGVLDLVAKWMIGAATAVTTFVSREMQQTTTPQLQSAWYEAQFQPMADLGAALGLLVAMIALASAAIRRSPDALAATLAGIMRAGIGTGLVVALTVIGLGIADQISAAVVSGSPHTFWATVAHAWGTKGFGGFGSSALAMLIALVEVFAAIFVWLELIVRNAAIYVAVLFFPAVLAAAIWPALSSWPGRLGRLLLLFVILKPVALIVLSLAGNAAAAGLSFSSGVPGSVGTILAAVVIFALAAFAPWALMYLLAADAESAYMAAGLRTAAASAVGDENGRSVRSAGGLANSGAQSGSSGGGAAGGASSGGGSSGGGGGPSADGPSPAGEGPGAGGGEADGGLAVGSEMIGAGSVGAAAGMSAPAAAASAGNPETPGSGSEAQSAPTRQGSDDAGGASSPSGEPSTGSLATVASASRSDDGAANGSSSERSGQGSPAGSSSSSTEGQSPALPSSDPSAPVSGAPLPLGEDRGLPLTRSPRRRGSSRAPVLAGVASRPRPPFEKATEEDG